MPHGQSWFSFLPFYDSLEHWFTAVMPPTFLEGNEHIGIQHVLAFAVVLIVLIAMGFHIRRQLRDPEKHLVPEGKFTLFGFIEMVVGAIYNLMADLMGEKPAKYFLPLIGTCALVIFFSNALGLIPGFLPPTDNLNTTASMALVIFVVTHIYGVKEQGFFKYFRHFAGPPLPWWIAPIIYPLMFVIETISHIVRPVTLAIRLMANMVADHAVLAMFITLFAGMTVYGLSLFWFPVPVVFYVLGVLVVTVQTLVFCLLSIIYIALAIEHSEEH